MLPSILSSLDETQLGLCLVLLLHHIEIAVLPVGLAKLDRPAADVFT